MRKMRLVLAIVLLPVIAFAQSTGTVNLQGPVLTPGAPRLSPAAINAAVNAALAAKADASTLATGGSAALTQATQAQKFGLSVIDSGAVCNGSTDDTSRLNAAFAQSASTNLPVFVPPNCYSASGVTIPSHAQVWGLMTPDAPGTGSSIICGPGVTICVTAGGSSGSTNISGIRILGTLSGGVYSGKGLYIYQAYNVTLTNVEVMGFGDCFYLYNSNVGAGGIALYGLNLSTSGCAHTHMTFDGWAEARMTNVRFGGDSPTDVTGTDSFIMLTGGYSSTASGPNSISCRNCQFNTVVANTAPTNWLHYTSIPASVDLSAFNFDGVILDSTVGGMTNLISVDSNVSSPVKSLTIANSNFNAPGVKLLNYNSSQPDSRWDIHDNSFDLQNASWGFPAIAHSGLRFVHNYINAGTGVITINAASGRADFSGLMFDGSSQPTLTGSWQSFTQIGGEVVFTLSALSVTSSSQYFQIQSYMNTGTTVASSATIATGNYQEIYLTGNTTVTSMGPVWPGRHIQLVPTTAAVAFNSGGASNVFCGNITAPVSQRISAYYDANLSCWLVH